MNWREQPHLFCNGKFGVQYETGNKFDIVGISGKKYKPEERCFLVYNYSGQIIERDIEKCQLIARQIESLTDEEWIEYNNNHAVTPTILSEELSGREKADYIKENFMILFPYSMEYRNMLYLLSIGVYPFDQSDFGKSVINAEEL